ncbi:BlaI/MecI/CopY family transcriptional regulator [Flexivirga alba]|jgi:Predicted transcriptional regulator|uniref:BlaI/MecI/CopY family transcriptional regulator n=1 Tax=Flexivirga alba TaxID=702742 RepID=A0ABW2ADF4_9MICO
MRQGRSGLGDLESAVMEQLWALPEDGWLSVREVHERLVDRDLAYTTVMTVLDRLAKKDLVGRERAGRAWRYRAAATRDQLTAEVLQSSLEPLAPDDRKAALLSFLDNASADDIDVLRAGLAEVERKHGR